LGTNQLKASISPLDLPSLLLHATSITQGHVKVTEIQAKKSPAAPISEFDA
jgi:hypothetical protein